MRHNSHIDWDAGACVSPDMLIHDAGSSVGGASAEDTLIPQMWLEFEVSSIVIAVNGHITGGNDKWICA